MKLTYTQAMDYALNLETQGGLTHHGIQPAYAYNATVDCGVANIKVRTYGPDLEVLNVWDVWMDPDGTIYGEC